RSAADEQPLAGHADQLADGVDVRRLDHRQIHAVCSQRRQLLALAGQLDAQRLPASRQAVEASQQVERLVTGVQDAWITTAEAVPQGRLAQDELKGIHLGQISASKNHWTAV